MTIPLLGNRQIYTVAIHKIYFSVLSSLPCLHTVITNCLYTVWWYSFENLNIWASDSLCGERKAFRGLGATEESKWYVVIYLVSGNVKKNQVCVDRKVNTAKKSLVWDFPSRKEVLQCVGHRARSALSAQRFLGSSNMFLWICYSLCHVRKVILSFNSPVSLYKKKYIYI